MYEVRYLSSVNNHSLHYEDKSFDVAKESNYYLLWLLYETHKYTRTRDYRITNVKVGGKCTCIYGVVVTS